MVASLTLYHSNRLQPVTVCAGITETLIAILAPLMWIVILQCSCPLSKILLGIYKAMHFIGIACANYRIAAVLYWDRRSPPFGFVTWMLVMVLWVGLFASSQKILSSDE